MNMKIQGLILSAVLISTTAWAAESASVEAESQPDRADYTAMLEEAELTRMEAESARAEAVRIAEMAREASRREAELSREEAMMARAEVEERAHENAARREEMAREREIRQADMARTREELSRAHRELREASREVAQAHRELASTNHVRKTVRVFNLGDRAVIGIIMGEEMQDGVEIIGVSPNGPAERAGLLQGDILLNIGGENLSGGEPPREVVYRVIADAEDGEELMVTVERDGEQWEYSVTPERREPSSWQSIISIPEIEHVDSVHGDQHIVIEHIEIPEIDTAAIESQMVEVREKLRTMNYTYTIDEDEVTLNIEDYSDLAGTAFRSADVWFGLPHTQGLELASINEGLGEYFKTDRGVLVIKAKQDNAYELESGDVILDVQSAPVNSPADMMRALREIEPGDEIEIQIKRERRNRTLTVVMPENRLGQLLKTHAH